MHKYCAYTGIYMFNFFLVWLIYPPLDIISRINSGTGFIAKVLPVVISLISPLSKLTSSSSPSFIFSLASTLGITASPIFIAFLKNIRAKVFAIINLTPLAFIASGACSLEEPHPKLSPATIIFLSLSFSLYA